MLKLRRWQMVRTAVALLYSVLCISLPAGTLVAAAAPIPQQAPVNARAQAMVDFKKRMDAYLELRRAITQKIPEVKETGNPAKIHEREVALGKALAMARLNAKAGDIFGLLSTYLLKSIEDDWNSRSPADQKAMLSELPKGLILKVNQPYPPNLPLATAPSKLLAQLPMLPEELEYRLLNRRLLLRDRDANLIVDVLVGTEPTRTE
jgi:hypothetical protein